MQSLILRLSFAGTILLSQAAFGSPYKLGVVLVVDQFRADYLMRFKKDFIPASGQSGGYRWLMEKGAYFPLADHGLLKNMTGPGHAAIMSGAYPYRHGISLNTWLDRSTQKPMYCVQDDEFKIIGSSGVVTNARMGISPKNFNASTVGDELKNVDRPSRVVSVSLKDRAAVLLGGKRADHAIWFDDVNCQWVTSSFYEKTLPEFAKKSNTKLSEMKNGTYSWGPYSNVKYCSKESLQTPWAAKETFDLALNAVDEMKLGEGKYTDLLLISLSSHDYLGHRLGPNDPNMKLMTLAEDKMIADFLKQIAARVPGGLKDVFIVLTGDHGVPPLPKALPLDRVAAENIDEALVPKIVEETMTAEFGKPKGGKWVQAMFEFELYLNLEALKSAKVSITRAVEVLRPRLMKERFIDQVWNRDEIMLDRKVPAGEYGRIADRTLSRQSGDIILTLKPFYYSDSYYPVTHMTHYSYDRYVPLIMWGKTFKPGTYRQIVNVVDIAPTLSSILEVIPPTQSEGRVITEILR
jgi:predicted AlkP superfamily pyrophosphatase or phosphodiesterase